MFGVLGNYEVGARHRWQQDTIYNYLQISTTIYNYRCISGDFWLSITFRSLRSLRTPPRSAADLPPHRKHGKYPQHLAAICFLGENENALLWQLHSYSLDKKTFHRSSVPICRNIYYLLVLMNETFCWTMFLINILINYGYLKCHVEMSFLFTFSIWSKYLSGSQSLDRQEFTHLKDIISFYQTEGQRICNISKNNEYIYIDE